MYLKCLEIIGFKSFAGKTRLEFEPGMTAIVGPNGCGKSNVADSIRWVLGEQSAKALRGSKMEDVIFNGTDTHKPLGMAEVSITLADCEAALGTEYREVTVTRRVFRDGEGQYFINKTACRLKDIQRLFMDTGIGTNAYSLMEQGRIDKILSSHPEDRRAVFEEASGITKYKADKREALRKLEQTEANLLRLDDIVREVKRQIVSLQRQAGKARRYQELRARLRMLDLFSTAERVQSLDASIRDLETNHAELTARETAAQAEIEVEERTAEALRTDLESTESRIAAALEAAAAARAGLERVREEARHNGERVVELRTLSERDSRDANEANGRREQHQAHLQDQMIKRDRARADLAASERDLQAANQALAEADRVVGEAGKLLQRLRAEQVDLDARLSRLQNDLTALDAREKANMLRRERLATEQSETQRAVELFEQRETEHAGRVTTLQTEAEQSAAQQRLLREQRDGKAAATTALRQTLAELNKKTAAFDARIELLEQRNEKGAGFPEGARSLLDPASGVWQDRSRIGRPLAELMRVDEAWQPALEAALRPWLDAVVLPDAATARDVLGALAHAERGAARLVHLSGPASTAPALQAPRLLDRLAVDDPAVRSLLEQLIGNVYTATDISSLPVPVPPNTVWVTADGHLLADGTAERWRRDEAPDNPLARQQSLHAWRTARAEVEGEAATQQAALAALQNEATTVEQAIAAAEKDLEERRRALNMAQGEYQVFRQEAHKARERAETVAWELKELGEQQHGGDDTRTRLTRDMEELRKRQEEVRASLTARTDELRGHEEHRTRCYDEAGNHRVRFAECRQSVQSLDTTITQLDARVQELTALIDERSRGISSYQARIAELERAAADAAARVGPLEAEAAAQGQQLAEARTARDACAQQIHQLEAALKIKRDALESVRRQRGQMDIDLAQQRMRRQNQLERVTGEYRIAAQDVFAEPEPAWDGGQKPDRETIETEIAELRAKLEAMGPVNLVAIEEHRELEERFQFLTQQQTDLVNAKAQLMEMIKQINKTTTELFAETFNRVNTNFQEMFTKLFGGGSAKLVLIDEGDVLESGIEIIARPPGKTLKTVSLLSGGERTMTAVALLFSLYIVKPSPFCVLDELDAALDDANIGRFVKTVQGFLENSQFVVITHNRQTIAAARTLYGVTMEERGISKIVSVKFSDHETREDRYPPQPTDKPAAPVETPTET